MNCSRPEFIELPQKVTYIEIVFSNCKELKKINFPDSLIDIDDYAFYNCTSLESLTLPEGIKMIGKLSFIMLVILMGFRYLVPIQN